VVGTLVVDGWAVTFGTARRGLGGAAAAEAPRNSPPINGQCTNHRIADGPLLCGFNVPIKGLAHKKLLMSTKGIAILFFLQKA